MNKPKTLVSIVILNWNGLDVLGPCLSRVVESTNNVDCEILVYDNGSTENGVKELVAKYPSAKLIASEFNYGFAGGNNRASQHVFGEYIVFLNNDTLPEDGWLIAMLSMAQSDSSIGLVGARIMNDNGTIQNAGAYFDPSINTYVGPYRGYPKDYPGAQAPRECEVYIACAVLIRRSLFDSVGGFDEGYFQGYEDYDISLKIREAGYRVMYCPSAEVIHFAETSTKRLDMRTRRKAKRNNTQRFFSKWGDKIGSLRLPDLLPDEMTPFSYYSKTRQDLINFMPSGYSIALEIGCGAGVLGMDIKKHGKASVVWGVELDQQAGTVASGKLDQVVIGDFLKISPDMFRGQFDLVVCADVIEHMANPWKALDRIYSLLKDNGEIIISIPNIRHYRIIKKLIKDQWRYEKEGILDKTHLRFFGLASVKDLIKYSGFELIDLFRKKRARPWVERFARIIPGAEEFITYQYFIRARKISKHAAH